MLSVSIIIPVYRDWKRLSLCIKALSEQTFQSEMFEIIVVNNDLNDHLPTNFLLPLNCQVITEETPGSYAARNAALRIAKGEIIGFTDSDCIPDKDWVKNAAGYFENNNNCTRIAGKVSIFSESEKPNVYELYDKLFAFNQQNYVETSGTCVTANMFAYKYIFDKIGYFDEHLMSGGDFLWGTLAQKKGYSVHYVENVLVKHPARGSVEELIKKEKRVGGSQAIFLEEKRSAIINLIKFIKELRPRLGVLKVVITNGKDLSAQNKIHISFLRHYLLIIRAYERLRVQLGKKPNRA